MSLYLRSTYPSGHCILYPWSYDSSLTGCSTLWPPVDDIIALNTIQLCLVLEEQLDSRSTPNRSMAKHVKRGLWVDLLHRWLHFHLRH